MSDLPEPPELLRRLTPEALAALDRAAYAEAVPPSEVVCRAIELYSILGAAEPGKLIEIRTAEGIWQRMLILGRPGKPFSILKILRRARRG